MTNANDDSLYGQRAAPVYDKDTRACDERMLDVLATLAGGGRAFELGIGTGRVALPLAARGVHVEGIDASPAMVERLRAKPGGTDIKVTIGSFADLPVVGRFELIYVVYNTFYMLLTQDEQMRCFQRVAEHLSLGGSFVLEGFLLDEHAAAANQASKAFADASSANAPHYRRKTAQITLDYTGMGTHGPRRYPLKLRVTSPSELDLMARTVGLRRSARWAGWDAARFTNMARSHISIYTRSSSPRGRMRGLRPKL